MDHLQKNKQTLLQSGTENRRKNGARGSRVMKFGIGSHLMMKNQKIKFSIQFFCIMSDFWGGHAYYAEQKNSVSGFCRETLGVILTTKTTSPDISDVIFGFGVRF